MLNVKECEMGENCPRPGHHWEHIPATWDRRVTESGVTFDGHWVKDEPKKFKNYKKDKECQ